MDVFEIIVSLWVNYRTVHKNIAYRLFRRYSVSCGCVVGVLGCVVGGCVPGLGRPVMSYVIYGSSSSSGMSNNTNESSGG